MISHTGSAWADCQTNPIQPTQVAPLIPDVMNYYFKIQNKKIDRKFVTQISLNSLFVQPKIQGKHLWPQKV